MSLILMSFMDGANEVLVDRTTPIGRMIGEYLAGQSEQEDHVIHLLFSANRWEAAYVTPVLHNITSLNLHSSC